MHVVIFTIKRISSTTSEIYIQGMQLAEVSFDGGRTFTVIDTNGAAMTSDDPPVSALHLVAMQVATSLWSAGWWSSDKRETVLAVPHKFETA